MNGAVLRMAFRNLKEHRRKSLTVGLIVAAASMLFVLGSSLLESATAGLRKSYRDRFTGDLYVTAKSPKKITAFGWDDPGSMGEPLPLLPRHDEVKAFAATIPGVEALASRSVAFVQVSKEDSDAKGATLLMGVDPAEYARAFPEAFALAEGASFGPEGSGLLASSFLERGMGEAAGPGGAVLLSSVGMGSSIREERVLGVLPRDGANPFLNMTSYVGIDSVRGLLGHYEGEGGAAEAAAAPAPALDEAELFGGEAVVEAEGAGIDAAALVASLASSGSPRTDASAWQSLVLKVRPEREVPAVREALESFLAREGIEAQVRGWEEGAGMLASSVLAMKRIFYYVCAVVAMVALLVIMNALVISVTERTGEIGTMRAIGASRGFVTRLIVSETLILSAASGLAGAAAGAGVVGLLSIRGIPAGNFLLRVMFGGPVLRPVLSAAAVGLCLLAVLAIGAAASWYPTKVALRVNPATAMIRA